MSTPAPGYPAMILQQVSAELRYTVEAAIGDLDGVRLVAPVQRGAGCDGYLLLIEADNPARLIELGIAFAQCWLTGQWSLDAHRRALLELRTRPSQ